MFCCLYRNCFDSTEGFLSPSSFFLSRFIILYSRSGHRLKVPQSDDLTAHVCLPGTDTVNIPLLFPFSPCFNDESLLINTPVKGRVDKAVNRLEPGGKMTLFNATG